MKITKSKLKQIIKEELAKVLNEQDIGGEYEGDDSVAGEMKSTACVKTRDGKEYKRISVLHPEVYTSDKRGLSKRKYYMRQGIRNMNRRERRSGGSTFELIRGTIRTPKAGEKLQDCSPKRFKGKMVDTIPGA